MNAVSSKGFFRGAAGLTACLFLGAAYAAAQTIPSPVYWGDTTSKEGWSSVYQGYVWENGNEATFLQVNQIGKDAFGGVHEYHGKNEIGGGVTMSVDARLMLGADDYRVVARLDFADTGAYLEAGYKSMRVFYDGIGGYSPLGEMRLSLFDERHELDRGEFWLEGGLAKEQWNGRIRYSRTFRDGTKDSTSWGDSNRPGTARAIIPSFYDIDETRDTITIDLEYETEKLTTGGGVRWEDIDIDNSRNIHRRAGETTGGTGGSSPDRFVTQHDVNNSDLFSAHAYVESRPSEKLILTGAASRTSIDTNLAGNSRIYGSSGYNPEYSPLYATRQQRDEGFIDLTGDANWKQYLLNGNVLYMPAKNWRLTGELRYENQSQDVISEFGETNVSASRVASLVELEGESERDYDEWSGNLDLTYSGIPNWVLGGVIETSDGNGDLTEDLIEVEDGAVDIARDTAFDRSYAKYGVSARWYPAQSLNFALGAYQKSQKNEYDTETDTTPPTGGNRFPAFITRQEFTTDDFYARVIWRGAAGVSFSARYDRQQTDIETEEEGLPGVIAGELDTHMLGGTVTWTPVSSVFIQGTLNYVWDEVVTGTGNTPSPLAHVTGKFDNNYRTGNFLVMVVVDERTDVQADYGVYRADNLKAISALTQPYGMDAKNQTLGVTLNRRVTDDMIWSLRYARAEYDEATAGGFRDFTADIVYGRVQMRF